MLLGVEIEEEYKQDRIHIDPYNPDNIGPNSYDVRLHNRLAYYRSFSGHYCGFVLDPKRDNPVGYIDIPEAGFVLRPGQLYLGCTIEQIGSDYYVPMYEGRSSLARLGIQSHISAGFGDIGFKSRWTLEIVVTLPVRIYPGMRIGQVYFVKVNDDARYRNKFYNGKYIHQMDPQPSKSHMDTEFKN